MLMTRPVCPQDFNAERLLLNLSASCFNIFRRAADCTSGGATLYSFNSIRYEQKRRASQSKIRCIRVSRRIGSWSVHRRPMVGGPAERAGQGHRRAVKPGALQTPCLDRLVAETR